MKHANLVMAPSVTAVVLVVLIFGIDSLRSSGASSASIEQSHVEAGEQRQISSKPTPTAAFQSPYPYVHYSRDGSIAGEAETREGVRKSVTHRVGSRYELLLSELNLTPQQRSAFFELLVELEVAKTSTPHRNGDVISEEEQTQRIAAVIGERNLQHFSELESNIEAYAAVHKIGSLLETNGVPLTDDQRRGLLKIVSETLNEFLLLPTVSVDIGSIEQIALHQTRISEYRRHLMELVPSVLGAQQVVYLDEQYRKYESLRSNAVEQYKKKLAAGAKPEDLQLSYPIWAN